MIFAVVLSLVALGIVLGKKGGKCSITIRTWFDELTVVKLGLLAATFAAIWLATRITLFYLRNLLDEAFIYSPAIVLDILASVLLINLCITLLKSTKLKEVASAGTQSVIIALLLFLPRATAGNTRSIYGDYGGAAILLGLAVALVAIVYVWRFVRET